MAPVPYAWCWFDARSDFCRDSSIAEAILEIFQRATQPEGWSLNGVRWRIARCSLVGLLTRDPDRPLNGLVGYGLYTVTNDVPGGGTLLWGDSLVIAPEAQGQGHASIRHAIDGVRQIQGIRHVRWLGCCSQSEAIFQRYLKVGPMYPFRQRYTSPVGAKMMRWMIAAIPQLNERARCVNLKTGVCSDLYRGVLTDQQTAYTPPVST